MTGDQISRTSRETLMLCYSHLFIPLKYLVFAQLSVIHSDVILVVSTAMILKADALSTHRVNKNHSKGNVENQGLDPQVVEALHVHGLVVEVVEVGAAHPR